MFVRGAEEAEGAGVWRRGRGNGRGAWWDGGNWWDGGYEWYRGEGYCTGRE